MVPKNFSSLTCLKRCPRSPQASKLRAQVQENCQMNLGHASEKNRRKTNAAGKAMFSPSPLFNQDGCRSAVGHKLFTVHTSLPHCFTVSPVSPYCPSISLELLLQVSRSQYLSFQNKKAPHPTNTHARKKAKCVKMISRIPRRWL